MSVIAHQRHAIELLLESVPTYVHQRHRDLQSQQIKEVIWVGHQPLLWGGVSQRTGVNSTRGERVGVFVLGNPGPQTSGTIHSAEPRILRTCDAFVLVRLARDDERIGHSLQHSALHAVELLDVIRFNGRQESGIISFAPVPEHTELYVAC